MRRSVVLLVVLHMGAALVGHARERLGGLTCGCSPGCWCKRSGLNTLRWVFPFGHR